MNVNEGCTVWGDGAGVNVEAVCSVWEGAGTARGRAGVTVDKSAEGPKGVSEAVAFGLSVTVGPAMVGIEGPEPAQEVRRKKAGTSRQKEEQRNMATFSS